MPGFKFDALDDDEPLFTEPFTLELPGVKGKFNVSHRLRLLDDSDLMPVSGNIAVLVAQIVPEEQDTFRAELEKAVYGDHPTVDLKMVQAAMSWISEQRQEAEKKAVEAQTGRPTGARSRSQRSSG